MAGCAMRRDCVTAAVAFSFGYRNQVIAIRSREHVRCNSSDHRRTVIEHN